MHAISTQMMVGSEMKARAPSPYAQLVHTDAAQVFLAGAFGPAVLKALKSKKSSLDVPSPQVPPASKAALASTMLQPINGIGITQSDMQHAESRGPCATSSKAVMCPVLYGEEFVPRRPLRCVFSARAAAIAATELHQMAKSAYPQRRLM